MENVTLEKAADQPRVRRGISQAAKNQLIASFTRNPPVKPPFVPVERTSSASPNNLKSPSSIDSQKPPLARLNSTESHKDIPLKREMSRNSSHERDIRREKSDKRVGSDQSDWADRDMRREKSDKRVGSDQSDWADRDIRRERSEKNHKKEWASRDIRRERSGEKKEGSEKSDWADRREPNRDQDKVDKRKSRPFSSSSSLELNPTAASSRRGSASSTNFEKPETPTQKYPDQLFNNGTGWSLINNPRKLEKEPERVQPTKSQKNDSKKESRSYKKKQQQSKEPQLATNNQPQQPMINVQPMITESGHVVLMTESGLCVPATAEMFQYQQWYDSNMRQNQNASSPTQYYYPQQQYYEKAKE